MKLFNNNNGKHKVRWLRFILLGGFFIKFALNFVKKDKREIIEKNFKDFYFKEKKEVEELVNGEESIKKYISDSCLIFTEYFIPCECNSYKPKILRSRSLAAIAVLLLLVKAAMVSYLFFIYPNVGKMAQLITREVYELVNKERAANNVSILSLSEKLNKPAEAKAEDMIANNYFAHKSPNGKMPWDWIDRKEYAYIFAGENLAMNFTSALSAHKALMLSESHKKNILNSRYSDIGIAVVNGRINNKNTNVLVQLFGSSNNIAKAASIKENTAKTQETKIIKPVPIAIEKAPIQVLSSENKRTENAAPKKDIPAPNNSADNAAQNNSGAEILKINESDLETRGARLDAELSGNLAQEVKEVKVKGYEKYNVASKVVFYSKYIFSGALIFMIVLFLVNIFVKINIQHKPVIIQTFLLILFIAGLLSVKIHFLEGISQNIIIF